VMAPSAEPARAAGSEDGRDSVRRVRHVPGVECLVEAHEELLHVPVQAALAHLVRLRLHEGVVPALGLHEQRQAAKLAGEAAGACLTSGAGHTQRGEEAVRDREHLVRRQLRSMEMLHVRRFITARYRASIAPPRCAPAQPPAATPPSPGPAWNRGETPPPFPTAPT